MTLRFFRRPTTRRTKDQEPPEDERPAATPSRRRTSTRKTPARTPPPEKPQPKAEQPAKTTRTRRGRRGGVGRRKKAPAEAPALEAAPVVEAAPARVAPPGKPPSVEVLLEQQMGALRSVQGSLSAIENRLARTAIEQPRVGIFVDVPNVIYAAERLRVTLDFSKVLDFLLRSRELVRATAYAPITDDPQTKFESQKFVQPFIGRGYRIVTKAWKRYADGTMKANFDIELAIDILTMSDRLDIVTLVSGDGDFRRLVELVQSKGVRVEVVAFGQSTASELRNIADEYIDLNDHLAELKG